MFLKSIILMNVLLEFEITDLPDADANMLNRQGENARGILVVTEAVEDPALKPFLERILRGVQIELDRDALWLSPEPGAAVPSLSTLMRHAAFDTVLVFGYEPAQLGLQINWQHYAPIPFLGKTLLFSHSLPLIMEERNRNEKTYSGPLWAAVKYIFT